MRNLILTLLVTGMIASPALAQDYSKHTVSGTVVLASSDSLVLDTPTGQMTFRLDSMLDRVRYDGLKTGTHVEITHKLDDQSARQVVTDVNMLQDPVGTTYDAKLYENKTGANGTVAGDRYVTADARRDDRNRLPATASPFGAFALLSLIAVFGGLTLRAYSKGTRFGN